MDSQRPGAPEQQQQPSQSTDASLSATTGEETTTMAVAPPAAEASAGAKPKVPVLKIRMPKNVDAGGKSKKGKSPRTPKSPAAASTGSAPKEEGASVPKKKQQQRAPPGEMESPRGGGKKLSIRIPAHRVKQMQEQHPEFGVGTPTGTATAVDEPSAAAASTTTEPPAAAVKEKQVSREDGQEATRVPAEPSTTRKPLSPVEEKPSGKASVSADHPKSPTARSAPTKKPKSPKSPKSPKQLKKMMKKKKLLAAAAAVEADNIVQRVKLSASK